MSEPRPGPPAVHVHDLVKRYKGMDRDAVHHLSFDIEQGAVIGLLGANGAGKTTLTKLLCGVTTPDRGSVRIFGADPAARGGRAKRAIGVVHQTGPFDMMLSALDNLRIAARFKGLRWRDTQESATGALHAFGLEKKADQLVFTLSGGELRRLQMIRALLGTPPLLILDEPSAGLDVTGRRQVWKLLADLRRQHGTTVLWTSHYVEELERNCRRVLIIHEGRLVEYAPPRTLAERFGGQIALVRPLSAHDTERLAGALGTRPDGHPLRVAVSDGRVEIAGRDMRTRLPSLLTRVTDLGIGIDTVEYRTPSLEDAFLALVGADR
ncbi:ABC transporter ATP-binding protein [Streptomyces clavuligerus]|uniref:Daunorubicin resistance ABC transporter ATPase subunit n=1 Tax=Streptomyces clavuligerus TaxID=1901 RepID=B5GWT9_STRCL|nr:ABC transporter ATP-binding protein [Streptomyces clavuligerus]ANW16913.1 multidrug ABC transporter ATP-binding protein [Streptomyces clavuligerus]AXU11443.1 ABC transporter ATP-binding protein [Streptomyces clavuligerus]EDY50785.1 daunorubicin resistance ABC transporter ATPase subunit [Streptomyces clavuligerus]EFG10563.1 Daunorubicin resistance ABC transporter ATPase subunit [Streptomyces clavuligerus]MBY6301260.1 ABC transporter ATP-binding protein [Streptomyces clavuligerus]